MPPTNLENPASSATASRIIATLLFWAVPMFLILAIGLVTTSIFGFPDKTYGRQMSMIMGFMALSCPNSLNAVVFAIALTTRPAIARHAAARFYVASAAIGVLALVLSIGVFTVLIGGAWVHEGLALILSPIVAAIVSNLALDSLTKLGWLPRWTPGICDACGYTLTPGSAGPCPECGSVRPSV